MNEGMLLLVDKPKGITSFDVIRAIKSSWKLNKKIKIGHAGTLDPNASGLMIVALGKETKNLSQYLKLPKTYEAEMLFGIKTDTGDIDGKEIEKVEILDVNEPGLIAVLESMKGKIELRAPIFSAIKKDGKPLYWYARNGVAVDVPMKEMVVKDAKLLSLDMTKRTARILFDVESGAYIRSLVEELARRLGTIATTKELRRLSIGSWTIDKAVSLAKLCTQEMS